jgi:hypothetical protein
MLCVYEFHQWMMRHVVLELWICLICMLKVEVVSLRLQSLTQLFAMQIKK